MSGDAEKIIEISLAKIESCKSKKVTGKAGVLHRNLLVNSLLNRVKTKEPLMNYRESKTLIDMDMDDYDMDKLPTSFETNISQQRQTKQISSKKQSSLVSNSNTTSIVKHDCPLQKTLPMTNDDSSEMKENKTSEISCVCDCSKYPNCACVVKVKSTPPAKKRLHSVDLSEEDCPRKRLRCLWTPNVNTKNQESSFSITSLSSLFGNLVADTDSEKNMVLRNKFVSAMVAC